MFSVLSALRRARAAKNPARLKIHPRRVLMYWLFTSSMLPAYSFDLMDAWQAARQYDAGFAASRFELEAGQAQGLQGRAQLLPEISLTGHYSGHRTVIPNTLLTEGTRATVVNKVATYQHAITMSQPLFDIKRYSAYRQGQIISQLAQTQFSTTEQQLMVEVAKAYFDVLLAQDDLAATRTAKTAYHTQLELARTAFTLGTATIIDTYEAQASYDKAMANEIAAQNSLEINAHTLTRLTGLNATAIQPLADTLPLKPPQPAQLTAWTDIALNNNPEVKKQQQLVELAEQELIEKRAGHLPVVTLTAGYQDNRHSTPAGTPEALSHSNSVGVQVSLPLFAGGRINAQISEAAARLSSARAQLEATRRKVGEEVRRAYLGVTNGAVFVQAQQQGLLSVKGKLDATRIGKEIGTRSTIDLLTAEQDYINTIKTLAEARYRYLTAHLALALAAGQLDESVFAQINQSIRH